MAVQQRLVATSKSLTRARFSPPTKIITTQRCWYSPESTPSETLKSKDQSGTAKDNNQDAPPKQPKKTAAQLDEELRMKMADLAGDGGDAGLELEDGQPVSMKRSVKNNMFRYI